MKDHGIIIDDSKTSLYKTDSTKSQTFKVETQAVLSKANYEKLNKNFSDANNPNQLLLTDLKNYDPTTNHWQLPESVEELEKLAVKLEMEKLAGASNINQAEIDAKQTELESKETELDALFKTAITNQRAELGKIVPILANGKAFNKVSDSEDYRKTLTELDRVEKFLLSIRYLENNGDCSALSSIADENTALTNIETIKASLGAGQTGTKFEIDTAHGISVLKTEEEAILTALKKELGENPDSPDIPEKLSDWQTTLKA
ncbi:17699_t:CDS:2, partial [Funneliformis geosporum]